MMLGVQPNCASEGEHEQFRDCCVTVLMHFMIFKIAHSRGSFGFCSAMTISRF